MTGRNAEQQICGTSGRIIRKNVIALFKIVYHGTELNEFNLVPGRDLSEWPFLRPAKVRRKIVKRSIDPLVPQMKSPLSGIDVDPHQREQVEATVTQ